MMKLEPAPRLAGAVVARGVRKSFGDHLVLDGVDLDVAQGTVHALLGPNGSGKTTMVQIMSTLLPADAGQVRVAGHDVAGEPGPVRAATGSPIGSSAIAAVAWCAGIALAGYLWPGRCTTAGRARRP